MVHEGNEKKNAKQINHVTFRHRLIRLMSTHFCDVSAHKEYGDEVFSSDCQEAYVISYSYGMGDPLASHFEEVGRTAEGGGITRP